jgi:peptidoglycan/LPS O-acetylase OafA/YrhL
MSPASLDGPAPLSPSTRHRIPELDALRGVAAMGVVLYHLIGGYGNVHGHDFRSPAFIELGAYGVHLFFIISGFVILMTIERKATPRDFVIARIGRLYPTYWVAVLLTSAVLATGVFPNNTVTAGQVVANLTMFQRFMKVADVDGAYWTLAYELAFYVLMLLIVVARLTKRIEIVSVVWMSVAAIYTFGHRTGTVALHARVQTVLMVGYCHLFVAGMMFYRLRTAGQAWHRHAIIAIVAFTELVQGTWESFAMVVGLLVIFYAVTAGKLKFIAVAPLLFLGSVSYALYAVHETAGSAMLLALRRVGLGSLPALIIVIPTFIILAWAITVFIERPALAWINVRWRQAPRPASDPYNDRTR